MINLFVLIFALIGSLYVARDQNLTFKTFGIIMSAIFGLFLIFHTLSWSFQGYHHDLFVQKRSAFEKTLENARENNNILERATITKKVALWNVELAKRKYQNTTWFLDPYIDDRIENVKSIE